MKMNRVSKSVRFAIAVVVGSILLLPGVALAVPGDPGGISTPLPTTVTRTNLTGSVGPGGLTAGVNANASTTAPGSNAGGAPRGSVDWNLAALFEGGCDGRANTLPFERAAGVQGGGLSCNGARPSGGGSSLEDDARALLHAVPWPNLVIESNPVRAIVAVPTYYWISSYDGSSRQAHASVTVQEGQTCTLVRDDDGNPTGEQRCSPNMVPYAMTVTASPTSYAWSWDDFAQDSISHRPSPPSGLSLGNPDGLGIPFLPPMYPESRVMHLFQDSSYFREPSGFSVDLTVTYAITWDAVGPRGHHGGSLNDWHQSVATQQHVQEIQVLRCLPEVRGSCP
jgi:hypothetical protein